MSAFEPAFLVLGVGGSITVITGAIALGVRHGIDWDHIAAITDITSSQDNHRDSIVFATLYALGHAAVVFTIGVAAIFLGRALPPSVDEAASRIVGVTLILLGVYVFVSLIRHGRDFRMRSRWMLIFSGVRRSSRWVKEKVRVGYDSCIIPRWEYCDVRVVWTLRSAARSDAIDACAARQFPH